MSAIIFKDRSHAGRLLAEALLRYVDQPGVSVIALPRGGVPVAYQVAQRLHASLELIVVRKLGVPGNQELAMGAIASGGILLINKHVVEACRIPQEKIKQVAAAELKELQRREIAFRGCTEGPVVHAKTVILVDDGIATGSTIHAAIQVLRQQDPARIVIAVPTASADSCRELRPLVDEMIVLSQPKQFYSVGQCYHNFEQTSDAEVLQLIKSSHQGG